MGIKARDYETLTAHERFQLLIEAMARKDEVECKRLEDSCPTNIYRCEDADFRARVRRAYNITVTVCLNMRQGIARIRMAQVLKKTSRHFAHPVAKFAMAAYLCGRAHGREEAGGDPGLIPSNGTELAEMLTSDVGVQEQLDEIRSAAEEVVGQVADWLCYSVGQADAVDLLSQWEGFGRFTRSRLGLEPQTGGGVRVGERRRASGDGRGVCRGQAQRRRRRVLGARVEPRVGQAVRAITVPAETRLNSSAVAVRPSGSVCRNIAAAPLSFDAHAPSQ
jgi:hypothetical protein